MDKATATITLPISGLEADIEEGDGYTERALLKRNKKIYETVPTYLASMTKRLGDKTKVARDDIMALLVPDEEFLMVECYKLNYGDVFEFGYVCPHCERENDVTFDLTKLPFIPLSDGLSGPDPTIKIQLPRSQVWVEIGMLSVKKESLLLELTASGTLDLNQADYQCLRTFDGKTEFSYEEIVNLPLADHKAIRRARRKLVCGYDAEITVKCPFCDEKDTVNILMHRDFLLSV